MEESTVESKSGDIIEEKQISVSGEYIFRGRYYYLLGPIGIGQIITAVAGLPALIVIPFIFVVIEICLLFYLRCSPSHQSKIQREYSGSTVRYLCNIPYHPESVLPVWFPWYMLIMGPIYLNIILLWHLMLYDGDLTRCGKLEEFLRDGRCLVEHSTTYAFSGFYLPILYAGSGLFEISQSGTHNLVQKSQKLIQQFPKLEKILDRAKERKVPLLRTKKILTCSCIVAICLYTFIPFIVSPELIGKVEKKEAMALFWLSLPIGALGLYLIPHILHGLLIRYRICRLHLEDIKTIATQELSPLSDMENAAAWWSLREYYIKSSCPLVYGLNAIGLAISVLFTVLCVLLVVVVVVVPMQGPLGPIDRFIIIIPFFLAIPFGAIAVLLLLREATLIREAQIKHGELLKREQQSYFLALNSSYKKDRSSSKSVLARKAEASSTEEPFFSFVEYTHDLIINFDSYPTIFGITITPALLNLIVTYLGTGLITIVTKIGIDS